jgi:hypothetical protein
MIIIGFLVFFAITNNVNSNNLNEWKNLYSTNFRNWVDLLTLINNFAMNKITTRKSQNVPAAITNVNFYYLQIQNLPMQKIKNGSIEVMAEPKKKTSKQKSDQKKSSWKQKLMAPVKKVISLIKSIFSGKSRFLNKTEIEERKKKEVTSIIPSNQIVDVEAKVIDIETTESNESVESNKSNESFNI